MNRIIYHSADLDGVASAAVVVQKCTEDGESFSLHPADYGKLPDLTQFDRKDTVYVLDFSFPPKEMAGLARQVGRLIWIDHHVSAIRTVAESEHAAMLGRLPGIREDGMAGCVLTWKYCYPGVEVPRAVHLLGEYDVWRHADPDTVPFQYGMRYMDMSPESCRWVDVLDGFLVSDITKTGRIVLKYDRMQKRRAVSSAFVSSLNGLRVLALNGSGGSEAFRDVDPAQMDRVEAFLTFVYDGKTGRWRYGLYHAPGHEDLDLSKIAELYGGGGHRGACGFQYDSDIITPSRRERK